MSASAPMTSALPTTRLPASVAGAVETQLVIVMKPTGMPASALTSAASRLPPSWPSGGKVHCMLESTGRLRSSSRPPAMSAAISTEASASRSVTMDSVCTCLVELFQMASSSCRLRVSLGLSWAETAVQ